MCVCVCVCVCIYISSGNRDARTPSLRSAPRADGWGAGTVGESTIAGSKEEHAGGVGRDTDALRDVGSGARAGWVGSGDVVQGAASRSDGGAAGGGGVVGGGNGKCIPHKCSLRSQALVASRAALHARRAETAERKARLEELLARLAEADKQRHSYNDLKLRVFQLRRRVQVLAAADGC